MPSRLAAPAATCAGAVAQGGACSAPGFAQQAIGLPPPGCPPWMPPPPFMMMPPWLPPFAFMPPLPMGMPPLPGALPLPGAAGAAYGQPPSQPQQAQRSSAASAAGLDAEAQDGGAEPAAAEADAEPDSELEPELQAVFDKVAAMEREKQQQQPQELGTQVERAASPCSSSFTHWGPGSAGSPCSPSAASCMAMPPFLPPMLPPCMPMPLAPWQAMPPAWAGMPPFAPCQRPFYGGAPQQQQPQQPHTAPGEPADAAPVPWTSFAADDRSDGLDRDLAQIISLPGEAAQQQRASQQRAAPGAAAAPPPSPSPAAAAKARSSALAAAAARKAAAGGGAGSLRRVPSTSSAHSSGEALNSAVAAAVGGAKTKTKRVLRLRTHKLAAGGAAAGSACASWPVSSGVVRLKKTGPPASAAAAVGLGPAKAGVHKHSAGAVGGLAGLAAGGVLDAAAAAAAPVPLPAPKQPALAAAAQQQQHGEQLDLESCLLGDMDSCLSGHEAVAGAGLGDLDSLLQEASDDGWSGLLGVSHSEGLEFMSPAAAGL